MTMLMTALPIVAALFAIAALARSILVLLESYRDLRKPNTASATLAPLPLPRVMAPRAEVRPVDHAGSRPRVLAAA